MISSKKKLSCVDEVLDVLGEWLMVEKKEDERVYGEIYGFTEAIEKGRGGKLAM